MTKLGSGVARYAEAVAGMEEFGLTVKGLLRELLRHNGVVVHTIDHRVKTEQSAKRKLSRPDAEYEGYSSLHDLLGLRITCYFSDDIDRIAKIIEQEFLVDPSRSVDKGKQLGTREFGYRSVHRVAQISARRSILAEYDRYKSLRFEIQIRTVVQHAWAEIEHDLGYKQETIPEPMSRRFSMLAGVLELVDYEFMALRDELAEYEVTAEKAVKETTTDLSLDLATLTAVVMYDATVNKLDRKVAATRDKGVQEEPEAKYLERRLSDLRGLGITSVTEIREVLEAWAPHLVEFRSGWSAFLDEKRKRRGRQDPRRMSDAPRGVTFFYLWLAMGLQARRQGLPASQTIIDQPGASEVWEAVIAAVGEAPTVSRFDGMPVP